MTTDEHRLYQDKREQDRREQDQKNNEMRERIIRVEQDILNQKEVFRTFKSEDFGDLKREVQHMRIEMTKKFEGLISSVNKINMNLAKWAGGFTVIMFALEIAIKYFLK